MKTHQKQDSQVQKQCKNCKKVALELSEIQKTLRLFKTD